MESSYLFLVVRLHLGFRSITLNRIFFLTDPYGFGPNPKPKSVPGLETLNGRGGEEDKEEEPVSALAQ